MRFIQTVLKGAYLVEIERRADGRGFFGRGWCKKEFEIQGLNPNLAQANIGFSQKTGTLRGMHYQAVPYQEAKLVRCTMGAIYDVVLDLRHASLTYLKWFGVELTAHNRRMVYVPEGCAHGYQTLTDDTEVFYQTSQFYAPAHVRGVRYDDPVFRISWPIAVRAISDADRDWPSYSAPNRGRTPARIRVATPNPQRDGGPYDHH
jgi:dTDP-4-dehydrorhamnose 3,5-epimerase